MKVGVYTPYLDTVGGGERYMLTIAEVLSKKNHEVSIFLGTHLQTLDVPKLKAKIQKLHGLDLENVQFIDAPFWPGSSQLQRSLFLKKYDLVFYLSDGSLFFSTAQKSILHFQQPLDFFQNSFWGKIKLKTWNKAIYNSIFTQKFMQKFVTIPSEVVYPPIDLELYKPRPLSDKKNQIISVGRFQSHTKAKKHEVMIEQFKNLIDQEKLKDWSLHLAGGAHESDTEYVNELKKQAKGYDIEFHPNIEIDDLINLYSESKIYWHAAGFGETDPKKQEHFGMTTVESMASGCVPVVINLGGQLEIVEGFNCGYLWDTELDLVEKTAALIKNKNDLKQKSLNAIKRAQFFSKEKFADAIVRISHE